jgi:16S rRNA (cytidine1402-2'-O)-methyltransferase
MATGNLYLVPSGLGASFPMRLMPEATTTVVHRLNCFIVEDAKTARQFLKSVRYPHSLREATFEVLNEHTPASAIPGLLAPLLSGKDAGLMSEAGCPGVADPGASVVRLAHARGIRVIPLVGPSAILLALMASGTNGQRFAFHGYLPIPTADRRSRIAQLEAQSARDDASQIFIETPYRNEALFDAIVQTCKADTLLSIAADLTSDEELVLTRPISEWKRRAPSLNRRPAVFVLYRGKS